MALPPEPPPTGSDPPPVAPDGRRRRRRPRADPGAARRGGQGRRRPGRHPVGARRRAARPGPRAARRRAGHGQDAARQGRRGRPRPRLQAGAVHARPDAVRRDRPGDLRAADGHASASARDRCSPTCCWPTRSTGRRRRPRPRCSSRWRSARSSIEGDRPPAARPVRRRRHPEPGGVRGHLPVARGAARPLPVQAPGRRTRRFEQEQEVLARHDRGLDPHDIAAAGVRPVATAADLAAARAEDRGHAGRAAGAGLHRRARAGDAGLAVADARRVAPRRDRAAARVQGLGLAGRARLRDARRGQGGGQAGAAPPDPCCVPSSSSRGPPPTACSTASWPRCRSPADRRGGRAPCPSPPVGCAARRRRWPSILRASRSTAGVGLPRRQRRRWCCWRWSTGRLAPAPARIDIVRMAARRDRARAPRRASRGSCTNPTGRRPARRRSPTSWRRRCRPGTPARRVTVPAARHGRGVARPSAVAPRPLRADVAGRAGRRAARPGRPPGAPAAARRCSASTRRSSPATRPSCASTRPASSRSACARPRDAAAAPSSTSCASTRSTTSSAASTGRPPPAPARPIVRTYRAERNQTVISLLDNGRIMAGRVDDVPARRARHGRGDDADRGGHPARRPRRAGRLRPRGAGRRAPGPRSRPAGPGHRGHVRRSSRRWPRATTRARSPRTLARFRRRAMLVRLHRPGRAGRGRDAHPGAAADQPQPPRGGGRGAGSRRRAVGDGHADRRRAAPTARRRRSPRSRSGAARPPGCAASAPPSSTRRPAQLATRLADAYLKVKATGRL